MKKHVLGLLMCGKKAIEMEIEKYGDGKATATSTLHDDSIIIYGDTPHTIIGGRGDDTIIIYGDNPAIIQGGYGDDDDSCSIHGLVTQCFEELAR